MKINNLELAVIFYIIVLFIFEFIQLGFITLGSYLMFNVFELIDVLKRRKRK